MATTKSVEGTRPADVASTGSTEGLENGDELSRSIEREIATPAAGGAPASTAGTTAPNTGSHAVGSMRGPVTVPGVDQGDAKMKRSVGTPPGTEGE